MFVSQIRFTCRSSTFVEFHTAPHTQHMSTMHTTIPESKHGIGFERTLRTEELAGDVEGLTSHDDDLLAIEQLLGNSAGQATKKVSLAVNDDLR